MRHPFGLPIQVQRASTATRIANQLRQQQCYPDTAPPPAQHQPLDALSGGAAAHNGGVLCLAFSGACGRDGPQQQVAVIS
jgi:hypothetical protein